MPADRQKAYYEQVREKRDGSSERVLLCKKCNIEMKKGSWEQNKGGILYKMFGFRCPECGSSMEESYILVGPAEETFRFQP